MLCTSCKEEISAARLRAIPSAKHCVSCAQKDDVPRTVGVMVWDHKTAPYAEIGTLLAKETAGKSHRYGPHFRLGSKTGGSFVSQPHPESVVAQTVRIEARSICHPERPRIGPSGKCIECALTQQELRVKWNGR